MTAVYISSVGRKRKKPPQDALWLIPYLKDKFTSSRVDLIFNVFLSPVYISLLCRRNSGSFAKQQLVTERGRKGHFGFSAITTSMGSH